MNRHSAMARKTPSKGLSTAGIEKNFGKYVGYALASVCGAIWFRLA